jgi:hypothetical protein
MQALKAVTRTFGLLFLLGVLIGIIFITDTLLLTTKQNQLNYIPADADLVIRIHSRAIIDQTIQSVLIDSEDSKLVNSLYRKLKHQKKDGKKITPNGIDYLSDVVLFKMPFKTSYVIGVLVKLNDEDAFEETIGSTVTAHRVAIAHNEVGLILSYGGKENNHASAIDLEQLADNILSNSTKKQKAPLREDKLISVGGKLGRFELDISENTIVFSGEISPNSSINRQTRAQLKEKGFHISASNLSELPFEDLPITHFDFNFLGFDEANDNGIPKLNAELLVGFKEKTDLITLLKDKLGDALLINEKQQEISLMNQLFFFKKLNDSVSYIGSTQTPQIEQKNSSTLFKVSGEPSSFFSYKSDGIALALMEMNPLFHATKQLVLTTQNMDIRMVHKNDKGVKFTGKILFKKGTYPINEIIRFLMSANLML